MLGSHQIEIGNNRIRYRFTIHRNITVIRGESATGKTTLIQLLQLYENRGRSSGIDLHCDKNCTVLSETRWQENLAAIHDSIVFVEEGNNFILSQDFADVVAASDNYYVLITRESVSNLPYSVTEIYGLRFAGRYGGQKPAYNELFHLYPAPQPSNQVEKLLTEDARPGRHMLTIHFGSLENEIYDPPTYFLNQYEDDWITTDLSREIIKDVDKSTVVSAHVIESPVLGAITPREISGGSQTLILMAYDHSGNIFNASARGDNCAKWILKIAEDKDLTITLHHIMDFGDFTCPIKIRNSGQTVTSSREYLLEALKFVK